MIPIQFRLYAAVAVLLAAMVASGAAGFKIADWRANSAHADEARAHAELVLRLNTEIAEFKRAIEINNSAVAILEAQTLAAQNAKEQAEQHAADLAKISASRIARLERAVMRATTAGQVLEQYWEIVK
jgi:hypothetical protein